MFVKQYFGDNTLAGMLVGLRNNTNRVRMGIKVERMVDDTDRSYIHQRLIPAIISFLGLSDEDFKPHLHQKS